MSIDHVLTKIKEIAEKYNIEKVVLFGSRARGDNSPLSDYDIAVFGDELSDLEKAIFCLDVEEMETLKKIDIVFVSKDSKDSFLKNINKDGVLIYGKTPNKANELW